MADRSPSIEGQADNKNGDRESDPSRPLEITIVQNPAEAKHTSEREAASDDHESKDLEAQVRAADAAEKQIGPAWFAAFFSFLGTALIAWSIFESRDSKQRELRAYVVLSQISHWVAVDPATKNVYHAFRATWENRGSTPASAVIVSICSAVLDYEMPRDYDLTEFTEGQSTIHPKGGNLNSGEAHQLGARMQNVVDGTAYAYVWGSVRYRDAFRFTPQRETRFLYRVSIRGDATRMPTKRKPLNVFFPHLSWHNETT